MLKISRKNILSRCIYVFSFLVAVHSGCAKNYSKAKISSDSSSKFDAGSGADTLANPASDTLSPSPQVGYRYYQFLVTSLAANCEGGRLTVKSLRFNIDDDWPNNAFTQEVGKIGSYSALVQASSTYLTHVAYQGLTGETWQSAGGFNTTAPFDATSEGEWLKIDFGQGAHVPIDGLWIDGGDCPPDVYSLRGSNDNATWTTLAGSSKEHTTSPAYHYLFTSRTGRPAALTVTPYLLKQLMLVWLDSGGNDTSYVVVRSSTPFTWNPTDGQSYNVGDDFNGVRVIYVGANKTFADGGLTDGQTYYYGVFSRDEAGHYSAGRQGSGIPAPPPVCGSVGNYCYDSSAALANKVALTPSGKLIEYVQVSGSFYIWKEVGGSRILRANGSDNWAMKLNLNGRGLRTGAGNEFTNYQHLVGRKCPLNVYIDDTNKVSVDNCLYYTNETSPQALNAAGSSQTDAATLGLVDWNAYGSDPKWYMGNIKTCADQGLRLPTMYETWTSITNHPNYPSTDTPAPTFSTTAANGLPAHPNGSTLTASSHTYTYYGAVLYWLWNNETQISAGKYNDIGQVVCVLP